MGSLGARIVENQNKSENIDKLLAQRHLYSRAKCRQILIFIITVPLPVTISIILNWDEDLFNEKHWIYVLYLILIFFIEKILEKYIERDKKLAASIQEDFDLDVLQIRKNEVLDNLVVDSEIVHRFSRRSKNNDKKVQDVTNWYSINIAPIKTNISTLLCQRTNIYYDFSVRKNYNKLLKITVFITSVSLIAISLQKDYSLKIFIIEVLLPIIPLINFSYKEITNNNNSLDNLEHLKNSIEGLISHIKLDDSIDNNIIRNIQDRIYLNRYSSPLIPDIFYVIVKPKLEDEMNYSIDAKIQKILQRG